MGMKGNGAPNAAEKSRQRVRSKTGGTLTLRLVAHMPAAFQADQQADREREEEPGKEFEGIHSNVFIAED